MNFLVGIVVIAALVIIFKKDSLVSAYAIFSAFYILVYPIGYATISLIDWIWVYKINIDSFNYTLELSFLAFVLLTLSYLLFSFLFSLFKSKIEFNKIAFDGIDLEKQKKIFLMGGLVFGSFYLVASDFVYLAVLRDGYHQRNLGNMGTGFIRLVFSFCFVFYVILLAYTKPKKFVTNFLIVSFLGLFCFLVFGGARALSVKLFIILILVSYQARESRLFPMVCTFLVVWAIGIGGLVSRYGVNISEGFSSFGYELLNKIQGSIGPVDSAYQIIEYFSYHQFESNTFFNNFYYFVPRILWADKPLLLDNATGFLTNEILEYGAGVSISPTVIGEMWLYGGFPSIIFGFCFLGFTLAVLDLIRNSLKTNVYVMLFYFTAVSGLFGCVREGLGIWVRDLIMLAIFIGMLVIGSTLFRFLLRPYKKNG